MPFRCPGTYEKEHFLEHEVCKCLIFQHLCTMPNNVRPKTAPGYSFTLTTLTMKPRGSKTHTAHGIAIGMEYRGA